MERYHSINKHTYIHNKRKSTENLEHGNVLGQRKNYLFIKKIMTQHFFPLPYERGKFVRRYGWCVKITGFQLITGFHNFPKREVGNCAIITESKFLSFHHFYIMIKTLLLLLLSLSFVFSYPERLRQACYEKDLTAFKYNFILKSTDSNVNSNADVFLPIYSNSPLDMRNPHITSVLVIQHGLSANADEYFCDAQLATLPRTNVLVVSPLFGGTILKGDSWQKGGDPEAISLSFNGSSCWINGCNNVGKPVKFSSSFDAYDQLVLNILSKKIFPSLKLITLSGFSAGAQFLNRYSWATSLNSEKLRFIISDAGTYMYLNDLRPEESCRPLSNSAVAAQTCDSFVKPASNSDCASSYNDYKYGLSNLPINEYVYFSKFANEDGTLNDDLVQSHTTAIRSLDIRYIMGESDGCNCNTVGYTNDKSYCYYEKLNCTPDDYGGPHCCDTYPDSISDNALSVVCEANLQVNYACNMY